MRLLSELQAWPALAVHPFYEKPEELMSEQRPASAHVYQAVMSPDPDLLLAEKGFDSVQAYPQSTSAVSAHDFIMQQVDASDSGTSEG